jgi:GT2 family glycosyltransferase
VTDHAARPTAAGTATTAVVIPAYRRHELTEAVVRQLLEPDGRCRVVVVDNAGDYAPVDGETVITPGRNLGWLRGTNLGIRRALADPEVTHVCMLNNDVVISAGFVQALTTAADLPDVGLVAPSYDDHYEVQTAYYRGPAEGFVPSDVEVDADVVDGTCLMLTRATLTRIGDLDERSFGRYGWGGADDLCLRVRRAGLRVVVTRRAYLQHFTGATAQQVHRDYRTRATAEMVIGMRRKYGRSWTAQFPSGSFDHHTGGAKEYLSAQRTMWAVRCSEWGSRLRSS